jgi:hypothetical protein
MASPAAQTPSTWAAWPANLLLEHSLSVFSSACGLQASGAESAHRDASGVTAEHAPTLVKVDKMQEIAANLPA